MKAKLLTCLLLGGSFLFAETRISIGVGIGGCCSYYPPPPPYGVAYVPAPAIVYMPAYPGPGYSWFDGYWYPAGPRYHWRSGNWGRSSYYKPYKVHRGGKYRHGWRDNWGERDRRERDGRHGGRYWRR